MPRGKTLAMTMKEEEVKATAEASEAEEAVEEEGAAEAVETTEEVVIEATTEVVIEATIEVVTDAKKVDGTKEEAKETSETNMMTEKDHKLEDHTTVEEVALHSATNHKNRLWLFPQIQRKQNLKLLNSRQISSE